MVELRAEDEEDKDEVGQVEGDQEAMEEEEEEEDTDLGQADAAEATVCQAEAEGLTLQPSDNMAS